MNNNCVEVDELILEIADYKNDLADMAARLSDYAEKGRRWR